MIQEQLDRIEVKLDILLELLAGEVEGDDDDIPQIDLEGNALGGERDQGEPL